MQAISFSLALLSAFMLCTVARAQKQGVIISMETGAPIADVHIYTNNNIQTTTNYKGEWKIPYPFTSLTFSHGHYVPLTLNASQIRDTLALLPKFNTLDEVIIWGRKPKINFDINKLIDHSFDLPNPAQGFDFFSLFRKKGKLSKKERQKHDEIINNY